MYIFMYEALHLSRELCMDPVSTVLVILLLV